MAWPLVRMNGWTLKLAWQYLFPKGRYGTFFTWLSVLGIALGVIVLTVVLSVMNGFDNTIQSKWIDVNGPVKILSPSIIEEPQALKNEILQVKGVTGATDFVHGVALVQKGDYVNFPKCLGVDLDSVESVLPLSKFLKLGQLRDLDKGIFLTRGLAQSLNVKVGDTIDVYSPLSLEAIKQDEVILPKELCVCGILETGWAEVDKDTLLCSIDVLQELYGLGQAAHGFSVQVESSKLIRPICEQLNARLPAPLRAYSWMELNADLLYVLNLEKTMSFFVLLFVVVVAAFSVSSGLMFDVVRKRREIALLRIWGASRWQIAQLFAWQSVLLSLMGVLFGFLGSALVLYYRNSIVDCLTGRLLPKHLLWNFYSLPELPAHCTWQDLTLIGGMTIAMAVLSSVLPAVKASFSRVTEGLRNE